MNTKTTQEMILKKIWEEISKQASEKKSEISEKNIDGLYIQKPENIFYLTNFSGSFGRILLGKKKGFLISDSRYSESAKQFAENSGFEYREIVSGKSEKARNFWKNLEKEAEISGLGFESHHCIHAQFEHFEKMFASKIIPLSNIIEKVRIQKTETEKKLIQKAASVADKALQKTVESFEEGISEKELALIFEFEARKHLGADGLSFDTIVAFGAHSAIPHHSPSDKKLEKNMAILIDCGVKISGYCSDMTRCFWFGEKRGEAFEEWEKTYQLVLQAQQVGIAKMKAGTPICEADIAAQKIFGLQKKHYLHTFGHGVGLEIHEYPAVSERTPKSQKFLENMVVTAEPGLYFSGNFGIRIEDLLCISSSGKPDFFSKFPK